MKTKNFEVKWAHKKYVPYGATRAYTDELEYKDLQREQTSCLIYNKNGKLITKGVAKRYYKDQPNRRLGNKIAFKKAVDQISDKSLRTELWDAYKQLSVKCINC